MYTSLTDPPENIAGYWAWPSSSASCEILFVGKGPQRDRAVALRQVAARAPKRLSWPRQIHSGIVGDADREGQCADCDALVTQADSVALSVVTADCVPIVLEGNGHLAVIHAGWRGLVQQIITATLDRMPGERRAIHAWIGPAIGACCYEVDWGVARQVAEVSHPTVIHDGNRRPHLDLAAAAHRQLEQGGIGSLQSLLVCTMCQPEWLWSHRRDRPEVGRNWTFAWRRDAPRIRWPDADPALNGADGLGE